MKKFIKFHHNGFLAESCGFFKDKNNKTFDTNRTICVGSVSCVLDCIYLKHYNEKGEKYIICEKLNIIDRKNKLKTL